MSRTRSGAQHRSLLLATVLLTLPSIVSAQTFTKISPSPAGVDLHGVDFVSTTKGFVCGDYRAFAQTNDGGMTWTPVDVPGLRDQPFYNVKFLNSQFGFLIGNSPGEPDIFRTVDGGNNWQRVQSFPLGGSWRQLDFVDANVGFMGSNGALVRTIDGGLNWTLQSGYPDCPVVYGMDFKSSSEGIVTGYLPATQQYGIFKTYDAGLTWVRRSPIGSADVVLLTSSRAIANNGTGMIISNDAGESWSPNSAFVSTGVVDLDNLDANNLLGVSERGDVWRSTDGGSSWNQTLIGQGDLPGYWSVNYVSFDRAYIVGPAGLAFASNDGGVTWWRMSKGVPKDAYALATWPDGSVLAATDHGYIQTTSDNGKTWDVKLLDPPTFGRNTWFLGLDSKGDKGWAVGSWGGYFKTNDRGRTWSNLNSLFSDQFGAKCVKFVDEQKGYISGLDNTQGIKKFFFRSRDGGNSWEWVSEFNFAFSDIEFVGQKGWALGGTAVARTTNGGETWTNGVSLPWNAGHEPIVTHMSFGTASVGYVSGRNGYLAKTTNGGTTWSNFGSSLNGMSCHGVLAVGQNEVWVSGEKDFQAMVKRSLDGGRTWKTWNLPGEWTLPSEIVKTKGHVFLSGFQGEIWRFDGTTLGAGVKQEVQPVSVSR